MGEQGGEAKAKKEAAVLSDVSLLNLAKEVRPGHLGLFMMLNIPTLTIAKMQLKTKQNNSSEVNLAQKLLLYWKKMRDTAKEKVRDLEAALRVSGYPELADILVERHRLNM